MTLHQLKILIAVAKCLNFRKASEELHLSAPSVFLQFKSLETEYQLKLHKKNGRGIELTHAGKLFLKYAHEIISKVESFDLAFKENRNLSQAGVLRICASYAPSIAYLPGLLAKFRAQHKDIHIVFRTDDSRATEQMILDGEIDLGFITHSSSSPSITYEHCRKGKIFAFGARKHFPRAVSTLTELSTKPLVLCTSPKLHDETQILLDAFTKQKLRPNFVMRCDSPESLTAAVKLGIGVGFLHRDAIEPEMRRGDLTFATVPELALGGETFVTYHKERTLNAHARAFLALLNHSPAKTSPGLSTHRKLIGQAVDGL